MRALSSLLSPISFGNRFKLHFLTTRAAASDGERGSNTTASLPSTHRQTHFVPLEDKQEGFYRTHLHPHGPVRAPVNTATVLCQRELSCGGVGRARLYLGNCQPRRSARALAPPTWGAKGACTDQPTHRAVCVRAHGDSACVLFCFLMYQ